MSIRAWCECNDLTEQQYYYRLRHVREFVLEHMDSAENVQLVKLPEFSASQYGLANTASSKFNLKYHSVEIELPKDGRPLVKIGEEFLRSEINFKPSEITRTDIYRVKYADRSEEMETGQTIIVSPIVPKPLIEHSFVSPSLASAIISFKYVNALPLYRIEQMFKQKRCPLTRATMANWMVQISQLYLSKLYHRFKARLLEQSVIHADKTPLEVLKEPGRSPKQKSYLWCYTTAKRNSLQIRLFEYQPSRAGCCPDTFLNGFKGILISDGYAAYGTLKNVTNACCWAHARRYWINAMPKGVPTDNCAQTIGLEFCNKLFELERRFESESNEDRYTKRNAPYDSAQPDEKSSTVVLNEYWNWLDSLGVVSGALKKVVLVIDQTCLNKRILYENGV